MLTRKGDKFVVFLALVNIRKYFTLATPKLLAASGGKVLGATESNVRIRIRRRIIQIQRKDPRIGAIVPIATAFESAIILI